MAIRRLFHRLRQHVTDSVGLFVVSTPLGAFMENVVVGMSDEVSFKSRIIVGASYLAGLGGAMGYGRDYSRRLFHITDRTKESYQHIHDMLYVAAATAIVNPPIYFAAGARDAKEIALATFFSMCVAFSSGGLMGYSVDLFRDLINYKPSYRIPERIRNARPILKKALAVGILATTIGLTDLIYKLTPDQSREEPSPQIQTQTPQNYINQSFLMDNNY